MTTHGSQSTRAGLAAGGPQVLASDADRDTAVGLLSAAFAEGRLTADEYDQRLSAAHVARTWPQLDQLTADLPAPPAAATGRAAHGMFAGADLCLLCVLLVACPPAGIAWLFLFWHRARADADRRLARTGGLAVGEGR